jgi:hypothetical protein
MRFILCDFDMLKFWNMFEICRIFSGYNSLNHFIYKLYHPPLSLSLSLSLFNFMLVKDASQNIYLSGLE